MHDKKFPHKFGGYQKKGEDGNQHNFIMTTTLINTFNCYMNIHGIEGAFDFKNLCISLAGELFEYALGLKKPKHVK
jgi:hypothetical protein